MPLLWLSSAFLLGILLASRINIAWTVWAGFATACFLLGIFEGKLEKFLPFIGRRKEICPLPVGVVLALLMLGGARFASDQSVIKAFDVSQYNGQGRVRLVGEITNDPQRQDTRVQARLRAIQLSVLDKDGNPGPPQVVEGLVETWLPADIPWSYGDRVEITGVLAVPVESPDFSYRQYLARQDVFSTLQYAQARLLSSGGGNPLLRWIYALRKNAYALINQSLPQPEAGLMAGILLGIDGDLPESVQAAFRDTGTAHIIAISGFNIAILSGLFFGFFRRLMIRWWALLFAIISIFIYAVLAGGGASVVRAAIMGVVGLLGAQIGRRQSGANTLVFTAALMAAAQPWVLWDISFQLSFAATLGLILYAEPFQSAFIRLADVRLPAGWGRRLAGPVGEYFLFTLAAQLTTLPVIFYHFQRVSVSGLIANPLALPPQPWVMILGGLGALVGMVIPALGHMLFSLTWPLLAYTIRVVELLARLPGGVFSVTSIDLLGVMVFYVVILALAPGSPLLERLRTRLKDSFQPMVLAGMIGLGLVVLIIWQMVFSMPDGRLHVLILDPSQPAVLVTTPGGSRILLNGSENVAEFNNRLGRRLPLLNHGLNAQVVTTSSDRILTGILLTESQYPSRQVLAQGEFFKKKGTALLTQIANSGIPLATMEAGQTYQLDKDVKLGVLQNTADGIAMSINYGNFTLLFPGGIPLKEIDPTSRANVIVLGKDDLQGQKTGDSWLALHPVVIAQPGQVVSSRNATNWLDTQRLGWVEFISDGRQLWVEAEK